MEEKELKTSLRQRIAIIAIAVIMLGSIIAGYVAIVVNGSKNNNTTSGEISEEKKMEYETAYQEELKEFQNTTKADYDKFIKYKGEVTAYNETTANTSGVKTRDLERGSGAKLAEGDTNYLAYYIGWCADETIFDSSLDDTTAPTGFTKALDASLGMIEGWSAGVVGMRLGGVREITVPGELAYAETREICGGYNKPLKFLVMAVANEDPLKSAAKAIDTAYLKVQYANYGIDYNSLVSGS